jgi:hypothetical protein
MGNWPRNEGHEYLSSVAARPLEAKEETPPFSSSQLAAWSPFEKKLTEQDKDPRKVEENGHYEGVQQEAGVPGGVSQPC